MKNTDLMKQWREEFGDEFKPDLYIDLDGVLIDFEKKALEVAGYLPSYSSDATQKKLRSDFWKQVATHVKKGNKFFEVMDLLPDALDLYDYIKHRDPTVLSATGHVVGAKEEKRNSVRAKFGHEMADRALFVRDASQKGTHAAPGRILIDDRQKALDSFIAEGGMGVLHKNAKDTIAQLKELGL